MNAAARVEPAPRLAPNVLGALRIQGARRFDGVPPSRLVAQQGPLFVQPEVRRDERLFRRPSRLAMNVNPFYLRLSRNPLPSNIAGIAFSIRTTRVADCLAAAKWYR